MPSKLIPLLAVLALLFAGALYWIVLDGEPGTRDVPKDRAQPNPRAPSSLPRELQPGPNRFDGLDEGGGSEQADSPSEQPDPPGGGSPGGGDSSPPSGSGSEPEQPRPPQPEPDDPLAEVDPSADCQVSADLGAVEADVCLP